MSGSAGMGGFALGLRGVTKVVGYCEIDVCCQRFLTSNIEKGGLLETPVFHDVTTLSEQHYL
jgi:hypothetical protein